LSSYLSNVSDTTSNMPHRLPPHTNLQESALTSSTPTTLSVLLGFNQTNPKPILLAFQISWLSKV